VAGTVFADFAGLVHCSPRWMTAGIWTETTFATAYALTKLHSSPKPEARPHSESVCSWVHFPP
jgi:hypothetical protein